MATGLIALRNARETDAEALAQAHEDAWRYAYQGIIPHLPLSQMIARRGPGWWRSALRQRMPALVLEFDAEIAGYVTYGPSRTRTTPYNGEIFELYVRPVYQGAGFGRKLFETARQRLDGAGRRGLIVWALADNDSACEFYMRLGGCVISQGLERFGETVLRKVAFVWA